VTAQPAPRLVVETFEVGAHRFVLFDVALSRRVPACFTAAERAILDYVRAGLSSSEIARARGTSPRTVANQLASMYRKTGVTSRHELIAALTDDRHDAFLDRSAIAATQDGPTRRCFAPIRRGAVTATS
jgi:DNA-binding CsgD family transcriptional regulator